MISSWEKTGLLPDPKCMNIIGERERANLVVQLARIFYIIFLYGSCRNVFLNIRRTRFASRGDNVRLRVHASGPRFHAGYQRGSCRLSMRSCRLPVLSDLLVARSRTFSTHCTDAHRRETMPKQHYITCLVQCVPTLHQPFGFVSTPSFYCRTLVGSLPLANNGGH